MGINTTILVTTSEATKLQVIPLPLAIQSNTLLFEVTVIDKAGLKVTDAKAPVSITVAGAGKLIGLDNGELDFAGPYKTNIRNAYEGRLLVTLERLTTDGEITLTATASGLAGSTIKIK